MSKKLWLRKNSWKLLSLLSALQISCATNVPNFPACVELHMGKGYCVKVISGEEFIVDETNKLNEKSWFDSRPSMIMLPPDSWAEIKKFIIKICKKTKRCQEEVSSWDRSIKNIDEKLVEKTGIKEKDF